MWPWGAVPREGGDSPNTDQQGSEPQPCIFKRIVGGGKGGGGGQGCIYLKLGSYERME